MIDEYDFCVEIIDSLNYSYFNRKPKLVLVLIHNFPTSLTISDDNLETNGWKHGPADCGSCQKKKKKKNLKRNINFRKL